MFELSDIVNAINNNIGLVVSLGVPLLLLIAVVLTWMSGILASVERLTFLRSIIIAAIESAVCMIALFFVATTIVPDLLAFSFQTGLSITVPTDWKKPGMGAGVLAVADLALLCFLLWIVGGASVWSGVKAWIIRVLLYVLLAFLLAGAALVIGSVFQVAKNDSARDPLMWFGLVVGGVVGAIVIIYFLVTALRSRAR